MPQARKPTVDDVAGALHHVLSTTVGSAAERADRPVDRTVLFGSLRDHLLGQHPDPRALDDVSRDLPGHVDRVAVRRLLAACRVRLPEPPDDGPGSDDQRWQRIIDAEPPPVPRFFPYVDEGRVIPTEDGRFLYDDSHLGRPVGAPRFFWPRLTRFRVAGRLELGRVHATVVTDCEALGAVIFRHVAYVFLGDDVEPGLVVAAETNETETRQAAERGEELLYHLGIFSPTDRQNYGHKAGLDDLDRFLVAVALLVMPSTGLVPGDKWRRADLGRLLEARVWRPADDRLAAMQAELSDAPGEPSGTRMAAQLRLIQHTMGGADHELAYAGCRNLVELALALGDLETARYAARWAVGMDRKTAVTCRNNEHSFSTVERVRPGRLLFRLCAAGHVGGAVELARESLRLCLTPRPRVVSSPFPAHETWVDDDFGDELLVLGMAGVLAGSGDAVDTLRTASRRAALSLHTAGVAAAQALLGICLAHRGESRAAIVAAARAVGCALTLEHPELLRMTVGAAAVAIAGGADVEVRPAGDVARRRVALERSLVVAYGLISDRLVVSTLLAGVELTEGVAAALFEAMTARHGFLGAGDRLPDTPAAWLARLARDAAAGGCPPIGRDDLAGLTVQTTEGEFHWTEHTAVNDALTGVGSALRLMTFGSLDDLVDRAAAIAGMASPARHVDTGFILGEVGPVTATPLAPLLDFCREYAVSPALPQGEAGYVFDNVIVLRRGAMRLDPADLAGLARHDWPDAWKHVFGHECAHVRMFSSARRHSYLWAGWLAAVVSDILRLCDGGTDRGAVAAALAPNFDNPMVWSDAIAGGKDDYQVFLDVNMREFLRRWSLERMVTLLVDSGLLTAEAGRLCRGAAVR